MGVSGSFRKLSQVIERYESDGGEIQHVEAQIPDRESEQGLNATLDVPISLCSTESSGTATSPKSAALTDDGGLQIELAPSVLPDLDEYVPEEISTVEEGVRVVEGGTVVMTVTLTFGPETERQRSDEPTPCTASSDAPATSDVTENDEAFGGSTAQADERDATPTVAGADDSDGLDGQTGTLTEDTESPTDQTDGENELDGVRNTDIPLYKDEECLQYLYDSFRTFEEMAQCIETSVSSETVRRYMIEADIHEPSTYDTVGETVAADESSATEDGAEDETDEQTGVGEQAEGAQPSPGMGSVQQRRTDESDPNESLSDIQLVADGIGLPDGLTIEDLVDAIESSMTVFDVQRELGLSKERTEELLKRLNLIDLVMCRLSQYSDQQVTQDEIVDRIRSSTMDS